MKKIISIEKDVVFPTTIGEITSIALDNELKFIDSSNIEGNFVLSGTYKMTEASTIEEKFREEIPTTIILDEMFDINSSDISIDNFNYEVVDKNTLKCNIDILINGVEEVILEEEEELVRECDGDSHEQEEVLYISDEKEEKQEEIIEEEKEVIEENKEIEDSKNLSSLFESLSDNDDTFSTYSIYIYRREDTLEKIMEKYKTTKEELSEYNDLSSIGIGSKIIIPTTNE